MSTSRSLFSLAVVLIGLTAVLWPAMANEKTTPGEEEKKEYHRTIDSFFTLLEQRKPGAAIDYIYDTNLNLENIKTLLAQKRDRFIRDMDVFGPYQDSVIAIERDYGELYAYIYVIAICDLQPVKMEFHFYKPKQRWRLHSFAYNGNMDKDIADIVKYELSWPPEPDKEAAAKGDNP